MVKPFMSCWRNIVERSKLWANNNLRALAPQAGTR
jgi:hypothetical protein